MPFKSMKPERKALLGVAAAVAVIVLGLASWSDAPDPYAKFDSGKASGLEADPEQPPAPPLPEDEDDEDTAEPKRDSNEKGSSEGEDRKTASDPAPRNDSADKSPAPKAGGNSRKDTTPVAPVREKRRATVRKPAPTRSNPKKRRSGPQPTPTVTSASVRALKSNASSRSVVSALGSALTTARMNGIFGQERVAGLVAQEPADMSCSYYRLAPGEPAPLVRLCFDANDRLVSRDFVAPPS